MSLAGLLAANSQWAVDVNDAESSFFERSAKGQTPHTLWIGCSDSRVPESVITGSRPGEIFVHRNIANQVHLDDINALSVLQYAVDFLGVQHVVVVGHSGCGGAAACLAAARDESTTTLPSLPIDAPLNRWLSSLTELVRDLGLSTTNSTEALPIIVDENVKRQVEKVCKTQTLINAWASNDPKKRNVWVHGWVYHLADGKLRDLNITRGPIE